MPPFAQPKTTIRQNVTSLMQGRVGPARRKAIMTIAKKNNINRTDARFKQAVAIARTTQRKSK